MYFVPIERSHRRSSLLRHQISGGTTLSSNETDWPALCFSAANCRVPLRNKEWGRSFRPCKDWKTTFSLMQTTTKWFFPRSVLVQSNYIAESVLLDHKQWVMPAVWACVSVLLVCPMALVGFGVGHCISKSLDSRLEYKYLVLGVRRFYRLPEVDF